MAKIQLINIKGEKLKDITLADNVWNIETNDIVLKRAIDLQLAATRQGTAKTKTRSEVSGGGRNRHGGKNPPTAHRYCWHPGNRR